MQMVISGVIVAGYRVASGPSKDYPYGTLEKQIPLFKQHGLNLERFHPGTLNVSIAPATFEMANPEYTFRQVAWTDLHPPEDFSFSRCKVRFKGASYAGYVYYPHPETKKRHFESSSLLEIISDYIPEIQYGDRVELELNPGEIRIQNGVK
ncbi:MAG: hypothetical protein ABSA23_07525 [Anaerolineales bacterium]|jgi:hypothetical protein